MHFRTHVKESLRGISGQDEYADGMVEHDMHVGRFLDLLDELGIADNTVVFYSTDNGPHYNSWPDAAATPFRGEKNTNWEGGWRVPAIVRWPGKIEAGSVTNEIVHHMDWLPTFAAIGGKSDIKEDLLDGYSSSALGRDYRVHLDGYNILPLLTGETDESPRKEIFYFTDDGDLSALRWSDWKLIFMEQRVQGTLQVWSEPFIPLRIPLLFNLRRDPYERAQITSNTYYDWLLDRAYMLVPAQAYVGKFLATFQEYPPRQKAASFSLDDVMEKLSSQGAPLAGPTSQWRSHGRKARTPASYREAGVCPIWWRRRESNPRPKTIFTTTSTCVADPLNLAAQGSSRQDPRLASPDLFRRRPPSATLG